MNAGRLIAVVVTHNRLAKLRVCVAALLAEPAERLAGLVVVDNASDDGTADWLAGLCDPRCHVLTLAHNTGGAGGFAAGLRHAAEVLDADWVLILDDDARPLPGALTRFHATPRDGHAAWAAKVCYPSGELCEMNRPSRNPFWHAASFWRTLRAGRAGFHVSDAEMHGSAPVEIDVASFVGLFVSRAAIAQAGLPDPALFIHGDDVLYCLAIRRAGGRIALDPGLHFEHDCESLSPDLKVYTPLWRAYYRHRNALLTYRAAAGRWLFWPVAAVVVPRWFALSRHYGPNRAAFRRVLRAAVRDGLRGDTSRAHEDVLTLCGP
ncbi:MAG: glycosyltransferase [Rhodobacterales bacterium]|nr:MAG: glycosyltransferase [Rhodobacterales bacterium]